MRKVVFWCFFTSEKKFEIHLIKSKSQYRMYFFQIRWKSIRRCDAFFSIKFDKLYFYRVFSGSKSNQRGYIMLLFQVLKHFEMKITFQ